MTLKYFIWLAFPLLLQIIDWVFVKVPSQINWDEGKIKVYLTGIFWSYTFWFSFVFISSFIPKNHIQRLSVGLLSLVFLPLSIVSVSYYQTQFHLPNVYILQYLINEPANTVQMMVENIDLLLAIILFTIVLISFFTLSISIHQFRTLTLIWKTKTKIIISILLITSLSTLSGFALGWHRFQSPLPVDTNLARTGFQYLLMLGGNTKNLRTPARVEVEPSETPTRNVLLIINESTRADAFIDSLKLNNSFNTPNISPKMQALFQEKHFRQFSKAWSNSGATNVSVPSILTGLAPETSTYKFHTSPTLWDYAKSMNLSTFLFTSQDWRWEHFDEFFFSKSIETIIQRTDYEAPKKNDTGVDDALHVSRFQKFIKKQTKPFFGVIQFNTTHSPCYGGEHTLKMEPYSRERCGEASKYLDSLLASLHETMESSQFLKNTLIISTSDHGENLLAHDIGRLGCFYDDAMRVPFWMSLPHSSNNVDSSLSLQNLKHWQNQNIQNIDIMPTLLDFWNKKTNTKYLGKSLLSQVDSTRIFSGQNTAEIRAWRPEGMFILNKNLKLILSNHNSPQLFDIHKDPAEKVDLWQNKQISNAQMPWIKEHINSDVGRQQLCERIGKRCPLN
jgi:hypothetical protein